MKLREYHRKQAVFWQKAAAKQAFFARDMRETLPFLPGDANALERERLVMGARLYAKHAREAADIARHHLFALIDLKD